MTEADANSEETLDILASLFCLEGEFSENRNDHSCAITVRMPQEDAKSIVIHVLMVPSLAIHLAMTNWLDRKGHAKLSEDLQSHLLQNQEEYAGDTVAEVLAAVDYVKEYGLEHMEAVSSNQESEAIDTDSSPGTITRIWMHLPSLSTKSKRDDMVKYAASYQITGIVCAGKPALLVLEAPNAQAILSYLSFIKSHSWADIPSYQKKISEKLREDGLPISERVFSDMQEITDTVYVDGMRGPRNNRGDMGALRAWLNERGLGDRLHLVFGANFNDLREPSRIGPQAGALAADRSVNRKASTSHQRYVLSSLQLESSEQLLGFASIAIASSSFSTTTKMVRNSNRTTSFSAGNSINSLTASLGSISLSSLTLDTGNSGESSDSDTVREGDESDGDSNDYGSVHSSLSTSEATEIISSFHSSSGIYSLDSVSSTHDRKIALWQAILVGFGVCAPAEATSMTAVPNGGQSRPSHFEAYYLPLPNSANKCKELLKQYVHVNLKDFARLNTQAELFPSSSKLIKYTFTSRKFYKLNKAKEELLQPMLRDMRFRYR